MLRIETAGSIGQSPLVNFKSNPENITLTSISVPKDLKRPSSAGLEPMKNYGIALANIGMSLDVKPLIPTVLTKNAVNTLEGERIYDSEGKLHSIVRDGDKIKTIYKMSKDDEGMIESIKTVSKKTGKPIMTQENEIEDGKYKSMFITEFSPLSAKAVASTVYEDGKAVYANKIKYGLNGIETTISRDFESGEYSVFQSKEGAKANRRIYFSADKKMIEVQERREIRGNKQETVAKFYNGALMSIEESKKVTMPNLVGFDPLIDPDLERAKVPPVRILEHFAKKKDGEETKYSNGNVETKTIKDKDGKEVKCYFNIEGNLEKVEYNGQSIEIFESDFGKSCRVTENFEDGAMRKTSLYNDGSSHVIYTKGDKTKTLYINEKNLPVSYHEDEGSKHKCIMFNEQGFVENVHVG